LLESAEVREAADTGKVEIGCIVTVTNGDLTLEVLIATSENKVSGVQTAAPDGPLGKALLGAEVGDKVSYQAPGGEFKYTIESIRPFEG
jgi:transcription elongation factor GreA